MPIVPDVHFVPLEATLGPVVLDTNDNGAVTDSLDTRGRTLASFMVSAKTGTHATHVVNLECSVDDSTWFDVHGASVAGVGLKTSVEISTRYVRAKVTTAEGGTSTVDVTIQAN